MVEFGLKLIDNRVSEWKDNYIDYETLQVLLKKAVEAKEKLKDLKARDPEAAQSIAATDDEEETEKREESSRIEIATWDSTSLSDNAATQTEAVALMHSISSVSNSGNFVEAYPRESGSSSSLGLKKSDSLLNMIARTDSSVTQWTYNKLFPQSGFKNKLKNASLNAAKKKKIFDDRIYEEVRSMNKDCTVSFTYFQVARRTVVRPTSNMLFSCLSQLISNTR
jgi:hypothetical protein